MHLAYAARLILRRWPLVLAAAFLGLNAGMLAARVAQVYTTTAHVALTPTQNALALRAVDPQRFFQTQSQGLLGEDAMAAGAQALADGTTAADLRGRVTLSDGATNDVLLVGVSGDSPERSRRGLEAVLAGIAAHHPPQVTPKVLWTGAATPSASPVRLGLLGLFGGTALGAIALVLWGAMRRPVLHPAYVALGDVSVGVYPRTVRGGEGIDDGLGQWLRRRTGDRLPVTAVAADDGPAARRLADAIGRTAPAPGSPDDPRLVCLVATAGRTSETELERLAATHAGPHDEASVVVVDPKTGGRA